MLEVTISALKTDLSSLAPVEVIGSTDDGLRRLHNEGSAKLPYATLRIASIRESDTLNHSIALRGVAGGNASRNSRVQYDGVIPITCTIEYIYHTQDLGDVFLTIKKLVTRIKQGDLSKKITVGSIAFDMRVMFDDSFNISIDEPDDKGVFGLNFDLVLNTYMVNEGDIAAHTAISLAPIA